MSAGAPQASAGQPGGRRPRAAPRNQPPPHAVGRSRVRRLHLDGLAQVDHTHPHQEWVPHWHAEWSVGAAVRGGCHCSIGGQAVEIHPGDLVLIPPQVVHTGAVRDSASAGPVHMVMLYVPTERLAPWALPSPQQGGVLSAPALARRAGDVAHPGDVLGWLRDALAHWQTHRTQARWIVGQPADNADQQGLAQVQQAVLDGTASVAALAARCGVSRKWMHLQMTRWTGMSPSDYLRTARLHRARALLDEGVPASQVAADCGFADQAHFTRWFRRAFGYTPGDWVAAAREATP